MKVIIVLTTLVLSGLLGYSAYLFRPPGTKELVYTLVKPVYNTHTVEQVYTVVGPDGQPEKRVRTATYSTGHMVPERRVATVDATSEEKLRFAVLISAAVVCGVYSSYILILWMWLSTKHSRPTKRLTNLEKKLGQITSFAFGAVAGLLTAANPGTDLDKKQAWADMQQMRSELDTTSELLQHSMQQTEDLAALIADNPPGVILESPAPDTDAPP